MLYKESLYRDPSPELQAFLSSHKSFGQAWRACERSDWMIWMVHHKTKYGNTAKLIQFAGALFTEGTSGFGYEGLVSKCCHHCLSSTPYLYVIVASTRVGNTPTQACSVHVTLRQRVSLERNPKIKTFADTWRGSVVIAANSDRTNT